MSGVYIAEPGGQPVVYPEDQARSMWSQGQVSSRAIYWKEGMAEWRPVAELFGSGDPDVAAGLPARRLAKDPVTLTLVLKVMLWISLGVDALGVFMSGMELAGGTMSDSPENKITLMDVAKLIVGLGQMGVFLVTAVIFLMWIYRANVNARAMSATGMTITPGWSVGWYFIPFANLWKPYVVMREIWQASHNPDSWSISDKVGPVSTWWTLWLVSNFLGKASMRASRQATNPDAMMQSEILSLLTDLVNIALCLVAIRMVTLICKKQCEWEQPKA